MSTVTIHDSTQCELGEGPLWHPERHQLFWFDILERRLLTVENAETRTWSFDRVVSAAGWVNHNELLIASERDLFLFDLETGQETPVAPLEADNPDTRSNDGRADPWGGFWIGTMGKSAEHGAGSIYRYYRGEVRRLFPGITIPNAICFAQDGAFAYFADTPNRQIMRQRLGTSDGWPEGKPEVWIDMRPDGHNPDGAVIDAQGNLWNAQWGAHRVACYDPMGHFIEAVDFPAAHTSCPAFGGPSLSTLFCTSAREHLSAEALENTPEHGMTFSVADVSTGQAEHRVIL